MEHWRFGCDDRASVHARYRTRFSTRLPARAANELAGLSSLDLAQTWLAEFLTTLPAAIRAPIATNDLMTINIKARTKQDRLDLLPGVLLAFNDDRAEEYFLGVIILYMPKDDAL